MKKYKSLITGVALALLLPTIVFAAAAITFPVNGGTGTGTKPIYGQVLVGNAGGTYTPTATSSLGVGSPYPFPLTGNATSTLTQFNGGLTSATTTVGNFTISGNQSLATWTTVGPNLSVSNNTLTDTTGSGTSGLHASNSFGIPTFASSNALNLTRAATVYIAGAPIAGTNTTISNPFALIVNSGNSYLGGLNAFGALNPGAGPTAIITVVGALSVGTTWTTSGVQFATQNNAALMDTLSAPATTVTTRVANSFNPAIFSFSNGTSTITNAATLYLPGPPLADASSSVITGAYSLLVNTGDSRFLGNVGIDTSAGTQAEQWLTIQGSTTVAAQGSSQISLKSPRAAIVAGNLIGGIDFRSNDTNITAPGVVTANISAVANTTHTASALGTDLVFSGTTGTTYGELMRITGAGNLGVGTSTPSTQLVVQTAGGAYDGTNSYTLAQRFYQSGVGVGFGDYTGGYSSIQGILPATQVSSYLYLNPGGGPVGIGLATGLGSSPNYLSVSGKTSIGSGYWASVAPTNGLLVQGNVGVGTTTPFAKLSVHANNGDTNTTLFAIGSSTATATTTLFAVNNIGQQLNSDGTALLPSIAFSSDPTLGIYKSAVNTLTFSSVGTARFQVAGGIFSGTNAGTSGFVNVGASVTAPDIVPNRADSTTGFNSGTQGNINTIIGGVETSRWTSTGYGIGTTTPPSKLSVANEPVGNGTVATTTVDFGDYATSTSMACFNTKNTAGAAISFYFVGVSMVVENNRCR